MGQQPNIELEISDLPRPIPRPAPARRWRQQRPGDLSAPDQVPSGDAFGRIGPDTGYALRLVHTRKLNIDPREQRQNAEAAVAAVAGARAARMGRAPTIEDVEVASLVLGYDGDGLPEELIAELADTRVSLVAGLGHSARKRLALVAKVPEDVLTAAPDEVRSRMGSGERLLDA